MFSIATLSLGAVPMGIFDATARLQGAQVDWVRLGERPSAWRGQWLAVDLAGMLLLIGGRHSVHAGSQGANPKLGIAAWLETTLLTVLPAC